MNNKCVLLNAKKMNFDGKLDFSILSSDLTVYDDTTPQQLLERIQNANIIITKEMEVSGEMIHQFPDSVKLICEAGTGYNNIDLDAANEKKITVCNIPSYSSKRVAHTAIMMILNSSDMFCFRILIIISRSFSENSIPSFLAVEAACESSDAISFALPEWF